MAGLREYIESSSAPIDRRVHNRGGGLCGSTQTSARSRRCASGRAGRRRRVRRVARDVALAQGNERRRRGIAVHDPAAADDRGEHVARNTLWPSTPTDRPAARRGVFRRARRSTAWRTGPSGRAELDIDLAFPERNGSQAPRRLLEAGGATRGVFAGIGGGDARRGILEA